VKHKLLAELKLHRKLLADSEILPLILTTRKCARDLYHATGHLSIVMEVNQTLDLTPSGGNTASRAEAERPPQRRA
jgi:hypothetical protein